MGLKGIEDAYALTGVQHGMLSHQIRYPDSEAYLTRVLARLRGDLDHDRFKRALKDVVTAHPALRTSFLWDGLDEPVQVVRTNLDLEISERQIDEARDWKHEPIRLDVPPLFRLTLERDTEETWLLDWMIHHIIVDGWSLAIVLRDVLDRYHAVGNAEMASPPPFRVFIDWLARRDWERDRSFWRSLLSGTTKATMLQPAIAPSSLSQGYGRIDLSLAASDIRRVCREMQITVGSLLHGVWAILLSRYVDSDEVIFGSTSSGRPPDIDQVDRIAGLFIATQPFSVQLREDETVRSLLTRLQLDLAEIREHEHLPLSEVQRLAGGTRAGPLFDTLLVVENYPAFDGSGDAGDGRISISELEIDQHSEYPVAAVVSAMDDIVLHLVFDSRRVDSAIAARMAQHFSTIVSNLVQTPSQHVRDIEMLSEEERDLLLNDWSRTTTEESPDETIVDLVHSRCLENPKKTAVIHESESLTYGELWEASGRLAIRLQASGVQKGDRVGINLERSIHHPVALLAILRLGAAFVMLDPSDPESRTRRMLERVQARVVLSEDDIKQMIERDDRPDDLDFPSASVAGDDLAYVMFTSGSTGEPKGVMITHANFLNSNRARFQYYGEPVGRFLLMSSTGFDSSLVAFFWTLASGGTLVIPSIRAEQDVEAVRKLIKEQRVTHTLLIPSLYRLLLDGARDGELGTLKVVIVAGEASDPRLVALHESVLPETTIHNEYGPTEACVWSTVYAARSSDRASVPIGRPILNTSCYILDRHMRPVPIGVVGELYIGGANVSQGYFGQPEFDRGAFVENPFGDSSGNRLYRTGDLARFRKDGNLEFLGRADSQVKVRGYRVETAGIEATLLEHPLVREAVVTAEAIAAPTTDQLVDLLCDLDPPDLERILSKIEGAHR